MKTKIALGVVLASVLAVPAFAAPPKHRVSNDHMLVPYQPASNQPVLARRSDVVTLGDRVVGADPDLNIRTQLEHDPVPQEY